MTDSTFPIAALHSVYTTLSRLALPLSMSRIWIWDRWRIKRTEADLKLVLTHLRRQYEGKVFLTAMMGFGNLIENTERFDELLAEARASRRSRPPAIDRDSVLKSTGRTSETTKPIRSAAEIIRDEQAFQQFRALKETL